MTYGISYCLNFVFLIFRERIDLTVKDLESKFQKHKQTLGGLQQQFQKLTTHSKQTPTS